MSFDEVDMTNEPYSNEARKTYRPDVKASNIACSFLEMLTNDLKIYVYQPYIRIRSINLNANSKVNILNSLYPSNSKYLFNGQILDTEKTFKHYNILNENKIVLISENMMKSNPNSIQKWLSMTSKKDFEEKINLNIKNDYRKEIARLKDFKYFKIENQRKKYKHFFKNQFMKQKKVLSWDNDYNENKNDIKLKTDFKPLGSPSCDPLPIFW